MCTCSAQAIFNFVKKRVSPDLMRHRYEPVFQVPFSSRTKFALQIVRARPKVAAANSLSALAQSAANKEQPKFGDPQNKRTLLTKGAPEVILAKCTHYMFRGARVPIDPNFRAQYQVGRVRLCVGVAALLVASSRLLTTLLWC